jgi:hypothetical protein
LDTLAFHDLDVEGIACRQPPIPEDHRFRTIDGTEIDREDLVDNTREGIERRLDGIAALDRHVPVQNFLEHFRVCHQPLATGDGVLKDSLGAHCPSVGAGDAIHRDVGTDEDHAWSWSW